MTLPVTQTNVADAYNTLRNLGINAQSYCNSIQQAVMSGSASATLVLNLLGAAVTTLEYAATIKADTKLAASITAYVQQQTGNSTLDVATALQDSMSALASLVAAIVADYPKAANGYLMDRTFDASGNLVWASFGSAQLPKTVPAITNWLATIS